MKLSVKKVERATKPGRYGDGLGLYPQVTKTGCKSWVLRFERGGKETMLGLGNCRDFSLEEARESARTERRKLADGINPLAERRSQRAATAVAAIKGMSFREAAEQYFKLHSGQWRNPIHRKQFMASLEAYAFPILGNLSVADIGTTEVLAVLEPNWLTKTETMVRVRSRIQSVLDWATVRGAALW